MSFNLTIAQNKYLKGQFPPGTKFYGFDQPQTIRIILENALGYTMKLDMVPKAIISAISPDGKVAALYDASKLDKPLWRL